jgi:hypothetical protein
MSVTGTVGKNKGLSITPSVDGFLIRIIHVKSIRIGICPLPTNYGYLTVGAQSIARAQSIALGHIGDVIYQKTKI